MLNTGDFPAVLAVVGLGSLMAHELRSCLGMLAFAQPGKMFGTDRALQSPLPGKPALPFAVALLVATPVVLALRGELLRVVGARLACR